MFPLAIRLLAPVLAALALAPAASAAGPLLTAVAEHDEFNRPDTELAIERIRKAGASAFRADLKWYEVAPRTRPAAWRADDPGDPNYRWQRLDEKVRLLVQHGLQPILAMDSPPDWAKQGDQAPADPAEVGRFLRAAALRYSGRFEGLPRVRYWQVWIEPNVNKFFNPQFANGKLVAPIRYRRIVNAFSDAVHAVHADNLVIAGGLSPFTVKAGETRAIGPLRFMRELLCMSKGRAPRPTCRDQTRFDIWSHHPYTSGGPTHSAFNPDDVSLGDLPEMRALLLAAVKARHAVSRHTVRFWVTEFSWDTNPPDPRALPVKLQSRWVAEALYRMWKLGIGLVTWLQLRDGAYPGNDVQSGLYFRGATLQSDRPKATLTAFRFPFVAFRERRGIVVWGRAPGGASARVLVEQKSGRGWVRLADLRSDRFGIFTRVLRPRASGGSLRARTVSTGAGALGGMSLAFSLNRPPDRFVNPFGG